MELQQTIRRRMAIARRRRDRRNERFATRAQPQRRAEGRGRRGSPSRSPKLRLLVDALAYLVGDERSLFVGREGVRKPDLPAERTGRGNIFVGEKRARSSWPRDAFIRVRQSLVSGRKSSHEELVS